MQNSVHCAGLRGFFDLQEEFMRREEEEEEGVPYLGEEESRVVEVQVRGWRGW